MIFGYARVSTVGAERWLRIPLDLSKPPVTFAAQAAAFVKQTPKTAFHGPTTGFVINYTPDHAVRFDIDGSPVECPSSDYLRQRAA